MRLVYKILTILSVLFYGVSESHACRINRPPEAKIALGGFTAVVIGRVTQAQYTDGLKEDSHPWEGTVMLDTVVSGDVKHDTFPIYRSGSSAACDDGQPVPQKGQLWVLYLSGQNPKFFVVNSFPLTVACMANSSLPGPICKVPREEMIAQQQRDEERRRVADEERRRRHMEEARAGCELPPVSEGAKVVVLSTLGTDGLSTTALNSQDVEVGSGFITIEAGDEPLYVVVKSLRPVIWRFSGVLHRLERVVLASAKSGPASLDQNSKPLVGATGLSPDKVTILPRPICLNYAGEILIDAWAETLAAVNRDTSKDVISAEEEEVSGFTVSSDKVHVSEPPSRPTLFIKSAGSVEVIGHALVVIPGNSAALESLVAHRYRSGVIDIDPASVVASVPTFRYDVLPSEAGLLQLVQRGALAWNRDGEFVIKQKIRFPAGLPAHQRFFLLRGVPGPDGDIGHSCVISEETGQPVRGSQC